MRRPIALGRILYANTLPLFHRFLRFPQPWFELTEGVPTQINQALAEQRLDLALVSTEAYFANKDRWVWVPSFCLRSTGAVNSVLLLSKKPIAELGNGRVGLTHASSTSVAVLQILLQKYYGLNVTYSRFRYAPGLEWDKTWDAVLVIGDDALQVKESPAHLKYDLGTLWKEHTGQEIVFALLARTRDSKSPYFFKALEWIQDSFDDFKKNPGEIIEMAHKEIPFAHDWSTYFSGLEYSIGSASLDALTFFEKLWRKNKKIRLAEKP